MFGINWSNPETLWLNLTNLGLGVVVLVCMGVVGYGVVRDLLARRAPAPQPEAESAGGRMFAGSQASHAFHTPDLGWTMADGGEPEKPATRKPRTSRKGAK